MREIILDSKGNYSTVTLDTSAYIKLLVKANITDRAFWPSEMEEGADALLRIRQIESDCIAKYGEFDWERLSLEIQDEYDSLCILLDELLDTEEPITLEEYKMQNREDSL
jgi:hypothetical protein